MKHYASRYCTFAVPDDWEVEPPFAFRERGEGPDRMTAQILERSLPEMPSAAVYAQEQRLILAELYEGFELIQEQPHHPGGAGQGYSLVFSFLDEDENPSYGKTICITCGPLVCQLMLTGQAGLDPGRDRLFETIGKTFTLRNAEYLTSAKSGGLTSETLRMSSADAAKGWPGTWQKFPRLCVSLPVPTGWDLSSESDHAVLRRGNAEIRLHREMGGNDETDIWYADRLQLLQDSGDRLLGSERGELDRGQYAAVFYEEKGVGRAWKSAAVAHSLELFLEDQQPLVWKLRAHEAGFQEHCQLLQSLAAATRFLDPGEWETPLAEPWVDYTLKGPWKAQGPGLYIFSGDEPTFVQLSQETSNFPLEKLSDAIVASMRESIVLITGFSEKLVSGIWRGHEAFYYSLDGVDQESGDGVNVRATWLAGNGLLFTVFVRGVEADATDKLARDLLESFQAR